MATQWVARLIIIAPSGVLNAAHKDTHGQIFADVTGEALADEVKLFDSVELSSTGNAPATHYATSTAATATIDSGVRSHVDTNMMPDSRWWQLDAVTSLLTAKSASAGGTIGQAWTFADALDDVGLQRIDEIHWLLRADGSTIADPLPDTYDALVGALTVVQDDGSIAADGAGFIVTRQDTPTWSHLYKRGQIGFTRVAGLATFGRIRIIVGDAAKFLMAGFWDTPVLSISGSDSLFFKVNTVRVRDVQGANIDVNIPIVDGDTVDYGVFVRNNGAHIVISVNGGPWQRIWTSNLGSASPLYAGISLFDAAPRVKTLRAKLLGSDQIVPAVSDTFGFIPATKDESPNSLHGVYNNVGLNGDEGYFNGSDSRVQLPAAAMDAAGFDGGLGGVIVQCQVDNPGVWTDGAIRYLFRAGANNNNDASIFIMANGNVGWRYRAGGVQKSTTLGSISPTGLITLGMTWRDFNNNDRVRFFYDGTQQGSTRSGNGTFTGSLLPALTNIGSYSDTSTSTWLGTIPNFIFWLGFEPTVADNATIHAALAVGTLTIADLNAIGGSWAWLKFGERYASNGLAAEEFGGANYIWSGRKWYSKDNKLYNGSVSGALADMSCLTNTGLTDHEVWLDLTIAANTSGGVCVAADDADNAQNCIYVTYNRADNTVKAEVHLDGVFNRQLFSVTRTYVAGATIRVQWSDVNADGTYDLRVFYDNVRAEAEEVSDAAIAGNICAGAFGLTDGGYGEKLIVWPIDYDTQFNRFLPEAA